MAQRWSAPFTAFVLAATALGACGGHATSAPSCASVLKPLAPVTQKTNRPAGGSSISIDAGGAAFDPTCVTGVPKGVFTVTFRNTGTVIHNVEIPEQHVNVDISPRHSTVVRIRVGAQPVVYVCRLHRQLGMVGVLIPQP